MKFPKDEEFERCLQEWREAIKAYIQKKKAEKEK